MFLAVVVMLLLLRRPGKLEPFYTPPDAQPPVSASWDTSTLSLTIGTAVDTALPRLGDTTPQDVVGDEVRKAMGFAVDTINGRRNLDLHLISVDRESKATNAVHADLLAGDVHVYSEHFNAGLTLRLEVVSSGGVYYLRTAQPATTVDPDDSGVSSAPADVFTRDYADFQNLV